MNKESVLTFTWIKLGAVAGIIACVIYPLMIAVEMPRLLTVACAAAFGPLISLASVGLYHLLKLHQKTVTAQIAARRQYHRRQHREYDARRAIGDFILDGGLFKECR